MGVRTSNQKLGGNFFLSFFSSSGYKPDSDCKSPDHHSFRKPRMSSMHLNQDKFPISPDDSSKSSVSRIRQYPEPAPLFRREIHAPCRKHKSSYASIPRRETRTQDKIHENVLTSWYEESKRLAFETFRHVKKDGNVGIDLEKKRSSDLTSDDSSVEELEIIEVPAILAKTSLTPISDPILLEKYAKFPYDHLPASSLGVSDFNDHKLMVDDVGKHSIDLTSDDSSVEELEIIEVPAMPANTSPMARSGPILLEKYAKCTVDHLPASFLGVSEFNDHKLMVDDVGNLMESMSVSHEVDLGTPAHRKLYESAGKRNSKLDYLTSEIKKKLTSLPTFGKKQEDEYRELFSPLTNEEEAEVSHAFSNSYRRKTLVEHENSNIDITGQLLQCLKPGAWLNDEVINLYLVLLKEREQREPKKFLKSHFFNTFFYKKLISGRNGYDFNDVRRWTSQRKIGYSLLECDKIFVPIHKGNHWCLAVIHKKDKKFQYLDSFKGIDNQVLEVLARYYVDEVKDKSGEDINVNSWKRENLFDLPEQKNGSDCGIFMIKYIDFYSRGLDLCFKQADMTYFRRRTVKEILRLKAE